MPSSPRGLSPPHLQLPSWKITQSFFAKRFNFIQDGFKATSSSIYQTNLFRHDAIVVSGDESRHIFFRDKALHMFDTFAISGGTTFDPHQVSGIVKRIASIQRPDYLHRVIPRLLSDCQRKMDSWVNDHILDPCSSLHDVTFQLVMRVASSDIASDPMLVSRLKPLIDGVDSVANTHSTRFPWLPGPVLFHKLLCSLRVYRIVQKVIRVKKRNGTRRDDMLQRMLDDGEGTAPIFWTMLAVLLAGTRPTGTIATWIIMQLSCNQQWSLAVQEEITALISTYASVSRSVSGKALTQALSKIPLKAWESQTPNLDLCIRETLRTSEPYTAIRKNNGPDLIIGPYTIPSGSLLVYPFADVALNPVAYPNPTRWDPSRVAVKETPFIGWGAGNHACKGQRLGTLNLKLMVACALMRFDITIVDSQGAKMNSPPSSRLE
ncbi:Cytochrome P450 [Penicillium paradoxum]|uniref:Cytochrome P450 n=1 Tax=Penicillium paradoxum TaxID=176176 RepID=UPI002548149F|nr:Cytochrome P450 [Penicillium paradoxum]KAJ5787013.1 Cytochrome P450 [Penicillium paradoxum]